MNYTEFLNQVAENLLELMPETLNNLTIEVTHINKLQGESYEGISVRPENSEIGVMLNLEDAFRCYESGQSLYSVLTGVAASIGEALEKQPPISAAEIKDYDAVKSKLMVQLVPMKGNYDMLSNVPYRQVQDMAMVYRMVLDTTEQGSATVLVTNSMCGLYDITPAQLHEDAMNSAKENFPYKIRDMQEVMCEMIGMEYTPSENERGSMYVATCNGGMNGAGCICYEGFMQEAAEKLGGNFYVLPSSIHEVILVPDDGKGDYQALEKMVREINETEVKPEDRLSNKVYHYDADREKFEKAEDFAKMQQKEPTDRCSR